MLDRTAETQAIEERRRLRGYLIPIAYFSAVGTAMIAWIATIAWASWQLISILLQRL